MIVYSALAKWRKRVDFGGALMGKLLAITWGVLWRTGLFLLVVSVPLWWMNRATGWDARAAFDTQDAKLEGKVGVAVVALAMPERYEPAFFENFMEKVFTGPIPWPINVLAGADAGIALMDPANPLATERFEPKALADLWGRTSDVDGVPWAEKYRRGEVRWVAPSKAVANDHGYFLYPARKGGFRTPTAKLLLKARYIMYAALPGGYLPHYSQTLAMGEAAVAELRTRHAITAGAVVEAFDPWKMETSVRQILDTGVDTLVLASVQPIYSDFEELRGSFSKVYKVVARWKAQNPGRKVKLVIAPWLATAPSYDQLWARHLDATAPPAAAPGQSKARIIISLHGLPVSLIATDSWSPRADTVVERIGPVLEAVLRAKGYGQVEVVRASEGFADPPEDPDNQLVSVAEEFRRAGADKVDLAIALPVEFMAENTDMLFTHAAAMFEGLPGYTPYQGPPEGTDWSKPYVRRFVTGQTTIIYSGAPGGDAAPAAGSALADALAPLWR
jgi:Ferrochelatase